MTRDRSARIRIGVLALLLSAGFAAVLVRLFAIQIWYGEAYAEIVRAETTSSALIERERGSISDRNGRDLAVSLPVRSVFVDPGLVGDAEGLARRLAAALHLGAGEVLAKIRGADGRRFVWIARKVDGDVAARVEKIGDPAIGLVGEYKRTYPFGEAAANVLGFAGLDSIGLEGIELALDSEIRGPAVEVEYVRDVQGTPIPKNGRIVYPHFEGHRVALTLDLIVQSTAERALREALERFGASSGSIVAIDPATHEILAMATAPSFDPNRFGDAPVANRRNRAVTDVFEPGSTFKAFVAAALLEAGAVTPETVFTCHGEIEVAGVKIGCTDRHGPLTFRDVIAKSCNVGMIQATRGLGPDALYRNIALFGFGASTGGDLPGERPGLLRPVPQWSALSRSMLPIGQEISVTALQLANATAALSTGRIAPPRIIREIRDAAGTVIGRPPKAAETVLLSSRALAAVRSIMRTTVDEGTGQRARIAGFTVAGKTGTAQIAGPGGYQDGKYNAVFVGWAPAENPVVAVAVVIREPDVSKGYYGGVVAAPAFRQVAQSALHARRLVPAAPPSPVAAAPARPRAAVARAAGRITETGVQLPDFSGYSMRDVHEALTAYPIRTRLVGSGVAVAQEPPPGVEVRHGATVTVRFGLPDPG